MVSSWLLDVVLGIVATLGLVLVYLLSRSELKPEEALRIDSGWSRSALPSWLYPSTLIRRAGIAPRELAVAYWPLKLSLAVLAPLLMLEVRPSTPLWLTIPSSVSALFSFDFYLWQRAQNRNRKIQGALSFFVDLMNAYLRSGASVVMAFEQAGRFGFDIRHPLAQEIKVVVYELQAGESFTLAFQRLFNRTGVRELERLAAVLEIGHQAGAPIAGILSRQGYVLREQQHELNRKLMSQKSILMLFAMVLVGLPMFGVIVLFPAAIKMMEIFQLLQNLS
ncbi:type II secretion system F family protein [Marinobacter fonticola]|uniref:type II secretion system F family protein n=1 Tax=Marinobacter fonticola TaxID=2603215 RepID=UPI0011E6989C|nr:type II secretion system F family protein [Marinobacter fonticola]